MQRRQILRAAATASAVAAAIPAIGWAQQPARLTILVPYAPGGPSDQLARGVGDVLGRSGRVVVADNRPGGGGQIASNQLKQLPADGNTLMVADNGMLAVNPFLYKKLSYDPTADFQPISLVGRSPLILLVPGNHPANSVEELIAYAQRSGKGATFASQGTGTAGHLLGEMFRSATKGNFIHVPYKGAMPAVQDLLGGQVDMLFETPALALQFVKDGRLKALATASEQRSPSLPQVATTRELGHPSVLLDVWWSFVARKGMPQEEARTLSAAIRASLQDPALSGRMSPLGIQLVASTPEELAALIASESRRLGEIVRATGASVD